MVPKEVYISLDDTKDGISFYIDCVNKKELPYVLAIECKETSELIGDIGVNKVESKDKEVELGYSICK